MQSIAATAGLRIDERDGQVVAAEKPREDTRWRWLSTRHRHPPAMPRGRPRWSPWLPRAADRRRAGCCRCSPKPPVPTGRKWPAGVVCCVISQRSDRNPASTYVRRSRCHARHHQGLRQARIVVGQPFLEPHPVRASRPMPEWTSACRQEQCRTIAGVRNPREPPRNRRPDPAA